MPCGGGAQGNYACSDGTGQWFSGCAYSDPLPEASTVKRVVATVYSHPCSSATVSATMNGQAIGTVNETRTSCSCLSSACIQTVIDSGDYPEGFPGYLPGQQNVFGINITAGTLCVEHVEITLTYTAKAAYVSAAEPVIPRSNVVNGCVLYRSDLTGYVSDGVRAQRGVNMRFNSSRGTTVDTITQRSTVTDNTGEVKGDVQTRRPGEATISATVDAPYTPVPDDVSFTEADYETAFRMTAYILADENDFGGAQVTDPCGLTGTFYDSFLYSNRGVLMQGSGLALNGSYVTIDWVRSRRPFNRANLCFRTIACPTTASGACAQAGTTIAVDTTIIPMGSNVNIERVGNRTAQDTGDRIRGYHIDVYAGTGQAAVATWGNFNGRVRYLGGAPCN